MALDTDPWARTRLLEINQEYLAVRIHNLSLQLGAICRHLGIVLKEVPEHTTSRYYVAEEDPDARR